MRGAELDRLEQRGDQKGHHPSTVLHPNGTLMRSADPALNAALTQLAFGLATAAVLCRYCQQPIVYMRGASQNGGVSYWVHDDGVYECERVDGHAEPDPSHYTTRKAAS